MFLMTVTPIAWLLLVWMMIQSNSSRKYFDSRLPNIKEPNSWSNNLCLTDDVSECVFIEIDKEIFKRDKIIIIGVIYRPPNSDLDAFNSSISLLLSELMQENKHCYIMGDYNINLLNYENHQLTAEFVDQLHSNSFVSLINKPTRVKKHSATLIDNIFTNSLCDKGLTI